MDPEAIFRRPIWKISGLFSIFDKFLPTMRFKRVLTLLLLGIAYLPGQAQMDNSLLGFDQPIDSSRYHQLLFSFNNLNFLRNTEYFTPIERGKTLFGYDLNPELVYYPRPNLRLTMGGFFRKDFGNPDFSIIAPFYSIKYGGHGVYAEFGNIEGGVQHRLIEPIYNIDYAILQPLENGIQFKIDRKWLWSDTWINWERMIYDNSPFKEEITNGTSNYLRLLSSRNHSFTLTLPFQVLMHHLGGQISTLSVDTVPITSMLAAATGLILDKKFPGRVLNEVRTQDYFVWTRTFTNPQFALYPLGKAFYLNLEFISPVHLTLMLSYWQGDRYVSPKGTDIFMSASDYLPNFVDLRRKLLFLRLLYQRKICKDLFVNVRLTPYHSFDLNTTEYAYSIYVVYRGNFRILNRI